MLCSLFSVFDPGCSIFGVFYQFKWFMMLLPFMVFNWQFFALPTSVSLIMSLVSNLIINMVKLSFSHQYKKVVILIVSIFFLLLTVGEFGMVPYTFTPSSHLVFNLSVSMPLWLGGMIFMFLSSWKGSLSHFVPFGCPVILIPFLVVVETLSNLIRPFSLSIRLMSNIMAGHMIMTLLGGIISSFFNSPLFPFLIMIQSVLVMFEIGVALVQAYVFMSLVSLYWKENSE